MSGLVDSDDGGGGDAYVLRAMSHLLGAPSNGGGEGEGEGEGEGGGGRRLERWAASLVLTTRLSSAEKRAVVMLGSGGGGTCLGWFALRLVKDYSDARVRQTGAEGARPSPSLALAGLRLAVRSLSLLFAELPPPPDGSSSPQPQRSSSSFRARCALGLLVALRARSASRVPPTELDLEIVATLVSPSLLLLVSTDGAEVAVGRCLRPVGGASGDPGGSGEGQGGGDEELDAAENSMVQVVGSVIEPLPFDDGDDAGDVRGRLGHAAACYCSALLQAGRAPAGNPISRRLLLNLATLARPSTEDGRSFLPLALLAAVIAADSEAAIGAPGRYFSLRDSLGGDREAATALSTLLLSAIASPEREDLTRALGGGTSPTRALAFRTLAELVRSCGMDWMMNIDVDPGSARSVAKESDLGSAAACGTLIRLATGELRICLGRILDSVDVADSSQSPDLYERIGSVVEHCVMVGMVALGQMCSLADAMDNDGDDVQASFTYILYTRHSLLDILDSCAQYLSDLSFTEDLAQVTSVMSIANQSALFCCRFVFAFAVEEGLVGDNSGAGGEIPSNQKFLHAMRSGIEICERLNGVEDEVRYFKEVLESFSQ